jgi:hypothetical protein
LFQVGWSDVGAISSGQAETQTAEQGGQDRYKWVALSNTTLSITMATIDATIVKIAMPAN